MRFQNRLKRLETSRKNSACETLQVCNDEIGPEVIGRSRVERAAAASYPTCADAMLWGHRIAAQLSATIALPNLADSRKNSDKHLRGYVESAVSAESLVHQPRVTRITNVFSNQ